MASSTASPHLRENRGADVFYFGNMIAETGDSARTAADVLRTAANQRRTPVGAGQPLRLRPQPPRGLGRRRLGPPRPAHAAAAAFHGAVIQCHGSRVAFDG